MSAEEKRVWIRTRPAGGMNTQSLIRFCSDPETFTEQNSTLPAQKGKLDVTGIKPVLLGFQVSWT